MAKFVPGEKYKTLEEAIEAIINDSDDEIDTAIIIPPASDGNVTEEEDETAKNVKDICGTIEVHSKKEKKFDEVNTPVTKKMKLRDRHWSSDAKNFQRMGDRNCISHISCEYPLLYDKSPLEIFKLFFDSEIENIFISCSNKYAKEVKNDHTFTLSKDDLWKWMAILTVSSYNERPQSRLFWSQAGDIKCDIISQLMSRAEFEAVCRYIHVCDNSKIDVKDRWSKIRPLINAINCKLKSFGIYKQYLSIDESIIPYFGKHPTKMYHREKPIRFGYQHWVLAGDDGTPFHLEPYQGKCSDSPNQPLGTRVVETMLHDLDTPNEHIIYFDNLFNSLPLLEDRFA